MSWDEELVELQAKVAALRERIDPPKTEPLRVPSIAEFVLSTEYLARDYVFPRQMTMLRAIFLEEDHMTAYDRSVLAEWMEGFTSGDYDELFDGRWFEPAPDREYTVGTTPDLFDRMAMMRERGRSSFEHVNIVAGRRGGKGEVVSMAAAYLIWQLMALDEPQPHVHADRGKVITLDVFAGNSQQARENVFADIVRRVVNGPCFEGYVRSLTRDRLVIATPFDKRHHHEAGYGTIHVVARETTVLAARGQTSVIQVFDEMAFIDPATSKAPADELFDAASPALDQARGRAVTFSVSSPSQRAGKFFELHREATEIDMVTGTAAYPEMITFQLSSWSPYLGAGEATTIPLVPSTTLATDPWFASPEGTSKCFPANEGAPVLEGVELRQRERRDPRKFRVERGGQWADVDDPFLEPEWITRMWRPIDGRVPSRQFRRRPGTEYYLHLDPSTKHDATVYAIAHAEETATGRVAVIDTIQRWLPVGRELNWNTIYDQAELDVGAFQPVSATVDQHGGIFVVTELKKRVQRLQLHHRVNIREVPHTRTSNRAMGDIFREALRRGNVRCYHDRQLELELRFLRDVNGSPKAPTAGPIRLDDTAICVMVLVQQILGGGLETQEDFRRTAVTGLPSIDPQISAAFSASRASRQVGRVNPARPRTALPPTWYR